MLQQGLSTAVCAALPAHALPHVHIASDAVVEREQRAEMARAMVRYVLQDRTVGRALPAAVSTFLHYDWRALLEKLYIEYGVESAEWVGAVQVVDDLVWLLQQHTDEKSSRRLEWLLPDLFRRVSLAFDGSQGRSDGERTRVGALRCMLGLFPQRGTPVAARTDEAAGRDGEWAVQ